MSRRQQPEKMSLPECMITLEKAFADIERAVDDMVGMKCKITVTALDGRVMMQSTDDGGMTVQ